ncbi:MAG: hypothetical protein AAF368_05920, partial [Planctomycetota bacterium]
GLGWSKGLSSRHTRAEGRAVFNLVAGTARVALRGLPAEGEFEVWVVDNQPGENRSVWPEPGDRWISLGRLQRSDGLAWLTTDLGADTFEDFDLDLVVVTENSEQPTQGGFLFGMPTFFQDRYTALRKAAIDLPEDSGIHAVAKPQLGLGSASLQPFSSLVLLGEKLFFTERFKGNGRTCGTCHPSSNNFTLDQKFIACLPDDDALFVAENNPALATLERPVLMREAALILENTNGFGDLENDFQMRGVQHTLGLSLSIMPAVFPDGTTTPPDERVGWSGDGAPVGPVLDSGFVGAGTLKHFAVGAVAQHFPRTLNRRFQATPTEKPDFRLPTDAELNALEAFQLSLGRQAELDLDTLVLSNPLAEEGRILFNEGEGRCLRCHKEAGANADTGSGNPNFDIGIADLPISLGELIDPSNILPDDGFGSPGNRTFNVQSLVEAADTGPYFHNNALNTLEAAVAFYNSEAFNNSPGAGFLGGSGPKGSDGPAIDLEATEVVAIAAFLRIINVQENARQAVEFIERASMNMDPERRAALFCRAADEVLDAAEVLEEGQLELGLAKRLRTVHRWLDDLCQGTLGPVPPVPFEVQARDELVAVLDQLVE